MKKTFQQFYETPKALTLDEMWETAFFSFDSNILLELFDLSTQARSDFLDFVEKIPKERRWLTFQAAREYHSKVEKVIQRHLEKRNDVDTILRTEKSPNLQTFYNKHETFFSEKTKDVFEKHLAPLTDSHRKWHQETKKIVKDLSRKYIADCEDTKIRIAELFDGAVGSQFDDDWLISHNALAEMRIRNRMPPGFSDGEKPANSNGDVFLWFELIAETAERKLDLVFITNDRKEDWFIPNHEGGVLCPRPELLNEMKRKTGKRVLVSTLNDLLAFAGKIGAMPSASIKEFVQIDEDYVRRKVEFEHLLKRRKAVEDEIHHVEAQLAECKDARASLFGNGTDFFEKAERFRVLHEQRNEIINAQWGMMIHELGDAASDHPIDTEQTED